MPALLDATPGKLVWAGLPEQDSLFMEDCLYTLSVVEFNTNALLCSHNHSHSCSEQVGVHKHVCTLLGLVLCTPPCPWFFDRVSAVLKNSCFLAAEEFPWAWR